jgi:2-methylisocitrate lyase-like PEP mutase family enzyme
MNQSERAAHFRDLHSHRPLATAIPTTSAGVSWSFGRADGQKLRREEMLRVIGNIVACVDVPVSADIESCYGDGSVKDVAESVRALISMGVAGINIEDSPGRAGQPLLAAEEQPERIQVARQTAIFANGDLVINARTDLYLFQVGDAKTRVSAVVGRARLYRRAGADCVFVPGLTIAGW